MERQSAGKTKAEGGSPGRGPTAKRPTTPATGLVLEQMAWSLARLGVRPPREWSELFLDLAFDAIPGMR